MLDDGAGDPASMWFLAESTEKVTQLLFVQLGDERARRTAARGVEAHVERPLGAKAEGALVVGELIRAQAQVEEDPVGGREASSAATRRQLFEVRLSQRHALAELGKSLARSGDGRLIGIESEQAAIR